MTLLTFNGYLIENRLKVNKVVFKVVRYFPDHTKVFYYDGDSFSERIRGATTLLVALGELRNTQIWCSRGGRLKVNISQNRLVLFFSPLTIISNNPFTMGIREGFCQSRF